MAKLHDIRKDYLSSELNEEGLPVGPFVLFGKWLDEAIASLAKEPTAMTLATSTKNGKVSARIVLLKGFDENGFTFFTNFESKKGKQLIENPYASLVFFWPDLERQVRVEGTINRVSDTESNEYFNSRPLGSRIGAWASGQSSAVSNRDELESRFRFFNDKFKQIDIPRPPHWGGFRLLPSMIEFWQGRANRLHDRIEYSRDIDIWKRQRLAP
jgi:pyridoxamine 5'-phosphate oxidase